MKLGFLISDHDLVATGVKVTPVDDYYALIADFHENGRVSRGWILPPVKKVTHSKFEKAVFKNTEALENSHIFAMPSTHDIEVDSGGEDKAKFMILALGLLYGLYLAPNGFHYMYRVAYEPGKLTGIRPVRADVERGLSRISEKYDQLSINDRGQLYAAIYWFLVGQSASNVWERFDSQYKVLDGIYKISGIGKCPHAKRPSELASAYGLNPPSWAAIPVHSRTCKLASLRNELVHEAKFNGEPIGYSNPSESFDIEFRAFNLKLICAFIGLQTPYITASVSSEWVRTWDIA